MVKQKVVMKLSMEDSKKRSKALKAAVGLPGVISAALEGGRMVVVGDGVDSVTLTMVLRRKMGYVELVSVGSAEEKKKDEAAASGNSWPINTVRRNHMSTRFGSRRITTLVASCRRHLSPYQRRPTPPVSTASSRNGQTSKLASSVLR